MQRDYEIMMTLDLEFWLMLCVSREEFSFRNVYVSTKQLQNVYVGTKQLYAQNWFKKFRLETPFLDDNVKEKTFQNL